MPTFIKTGYWDKKAKAPDGWLDLNLFVETLIPPTPSTNIYNSNGTITGNRTLSGASNDLTFADLNTFKTIVGSTEIGLKLDFANKKFFLGENSWPFGVEVDFNNNFISIGDPTAAASGTTLFIDNSNTIIKSQYNSNDIGLKLDFANNEYRLGDVNNHNYLISNNNGIYLGDYFANFNTTIFSIDDTNSLIKTSYQSNDIGLKLDFANSNYEFGQLTGNNATKLKIDDAAAFPVQVSGTNVTQNTSGTASGKFLKIKVDGVDYVIELKNPS